MELLADWRAALVLSTCLCLVCLPADAGDEAESDPALDERGNQGPIITLQVENDYFVSDDDSQYTHGMRLSYYSGANEVPGLVRKGAQYLPFFAEWGDLRSSFAIGQNTFTPDDLSATGVVEDDRPYAGWLHFDIGVSSDTYRRRDLVELSLGVVGPASYADKVQTEFHKIIDAPIGEGWDNQIKTEPAIMLTYERQYRDYDPLHIYDVEVDAVPNWGFAVGNVYTYASTGIMFRLGSDLSQDYGPPLIQPGLPGSGYFERRGWDEFNWYVFGGVDGRAVAYNIFLDGNTYQSSHSVSKEILVGEVQAGIVMTLGDLRMGFTQVFRSPEFEGQDDPDHYGGITVSAGF
jgi:hypothetical protein